MEVIITNFPETKVAVLEHRGSPALESESVKKFISWRIQNKITNSELHRSYGVHYNNPFTAEPEEYHVDLCLSVPNDIPENSFGIVNKFIPACRCAVIRHYGSRENVIAAQYLCEEWLPHSGESAGNYPIFFHYVNVGPNIRTKDLVTDVYLPLL